MRAARVRKHCFAFYGQRALAYGYPKKWNLACEDSRVSQAVIQFCAGVLEGVGR